MSTIPTNGTVILARMLGSARRSISLFNFIAFNMAGRSASLR